mmetsp:Transcript_4547/g.6378  ORF Transcript_4547/g.6378 Transcript_4547/m.6378 type:complete len:405 (+) Transcript_4547:279-1493(+)
MNHKSLDIGQLHLLWEKYSLTMSHLRRHENAKHLVDVMIRSRELLSYWIIYCLVHQSACLQFPLVKSYGVCLDAENLRHLVLSKKQAVDAAICVHAYLLDSYKRGKELFSMRNKYPSFEFAEIYGSNDANITTILREETEYIEKQISERWEKIKEKKNKAHELRMELEKVEQSKKPNDYNYLSRNAQKIETDLKAAEKPPDPLLLSLPKDRKLALRALGFLHLPRDLCHLLDLGFAAQNLLNLKNNSLQPTSTSFTSYYIGRSTHCKKGLIQTVAKLSTSNKVPTSFGPTNIDEFQCRSDGVWYPDNLLCSSSLTIMWKGVYCNPFFNPVDENNLEITAKYFTDMYTQEEYIPLNFSLLQYGEKKFSQTRGNIPLASQSIKPDSFRKVEFEPILTSRSADFAAL